MPNDTDADFLRRLSELENDLSSLQRSSVDKFNCQWTALVDDLRVAIDSQSLNEKTVMIARTLADKVSMTIASFLDLEKLAEKLMSSLLDDTRPLTQISSPYLKLAYDWLLENLHNPYPSSDIRSTIANKSGAARKDVDNWFIDARKRIGWNQARKAHFSNKRVEIVHAATHFFANDEKLPLSPEAEHSLASIMKTAQGLYSERFYETLLASKLDAAVTDLTPQSKTDVKVDQMHQWQLQKDRKSYPTPQCSPEPSPLVHLQDADNDDSSSRIGWKRRGPSNESLGQPRAAKRPRKDPSSLGDKDTVDTYTGLPSPLSSIDEPLDTVEPSTEPGPSPPSVSLPDVPSKKRRLSNCDRQGESKRFRHCPAAPCLSTLPDSFSQLDDTLLFDETAYDRWFQKTLDVPQASELSPSGFTLELGNLSDFKCITPPDSHSSSPAILAKNLEPPTLEIANVTSLDVPWSDLDFGWSDSLILPTNNTVAPNMLVNFVEQEPRVLLGQDLSNFQGCAQEPRSLADLDGWFPANPTLVDPVAPLTFVSNEIWDVSTTTPNDAPDLPKQSIFNLMENGLVSCDFEDNVDPLASSYLGVSQDKARQEKEREFREAYAKAQRLALELQKGDVFAL